MPRNARSTRQDATITLRERDRIIRILTITDTPTTEDERIIESQADAILGIILRPDTTGTIIPVFIGAGFGILITIIITALARTWEWI